MELCKKPHSNMFDTPMDAGGDANTESSPAISETVSEGSNATAEDIQTGGEPTPELTTPDVPASTDDEEAALIAAANDPNTPKWAREKIQQAMAYSGKLKESKSTIESQLNELREQYEGKQTLDPTELDRMRGAEDQLFALQSVTATPQDLDKAIRELNPRVYQDYVNHQVWNALTNPDGTANMDNLQTVVDQFAGESGTVKASDVLLAVNALKAGTIDPADFQNFSSPQEYEAFQRQSAREKELETRQQAIDNNARFQEEQIRQSTIAQATGELQNQIVSRIEQLQEKFKLAPVAGEPKIASEFKEELNARIAQEVSNSASIRELGEIKKAFDLLGKAGKKPTDAPTAISEIQSFLKTPQYQALSARGIAELNNRVEKLVSKAAYQYKLLMKGYESEATKGQDARPVLGAANQGTLPKLTEADLARMSAKQRAERAAMDLTAQLREQNPAYGQSRIG